MIKINKIYFRIVVTALILVFSTLLCTVGAWMVLTPSVTLAGGEAKMEAVNIDASYSLNYSESNPGVPGQTVDLELTLTINSKAATNRDFVYEISLPEDLELYSHPNGAGYKLGLGEILGFDFDGSALVKDGEKLYGVMKKNESTISLDFTMQVKFYSVEEDKDKLIRVSSDGVEGTKMYDGNISQGKNFDLPGMTVAYCQTTKQAVIDVFGVDGSTAEQILAKGNGG